MASDRFDGPTWTAPKQWFQTDHAPIVDGTVPDRLNRFAASIMEGDKQTAYQLSLGLHAEPDPAVRRQLESQLLFCGIIDLQETLLGGRKMQNIGHKALRARALVHLAEVIGWEHASRAALLRGARHRDDAAALHALRPLDADPGHELPPGPLHAQAAE